MCHWRLGDCWEVSVFLTPSHLALHLPHITGPGPCIKVSHSTLRAGCTETLLHIIISELEIGAVSGGRALAGGCSQSRTTAASAFQLRGSPRVLGCAGPAL